MKFQTCVVRTTLDIDVCFTSNKNNLLEVVIVARNKAKIFERLVVVIIDIRQYANPRAPLLPT
jgi:hypothetical protein